MLLTRKEYKQSLSLLDHPVLRSPLLRELSHWGREALNISILNYFCDRMKETGTQRLRLLLWDRTEWARTMLHMEHSYGHDPQVQEKAATQFAALARKYRLHRAYWQAEGILVVFDTLRDEIEKDVLDQACGELEALAEGDVWRVMVHFGAIHVLYGTDEQLRQHEADGSCEALRQRCCDIVGPYDRRRVFDHGPPCFFTSHQTLEEKYGGNLFFYFR